MAGENSQAATCHLAKPAYGVSVVIPAYNYERYVAEAIDSALAQTHPNVEVIVVDDGSTDGTRQVVARFGDRVRYIHQQNAGLSAARNTGVRAARHPLVAFLDADDVFLPEMLARLTSALDKLGPDYGLVACDCLKVTLTGDVIAQKSLAPKGPMEVRTRDLILRNRFVADAVVARRDALLKAGLFDITLKSSEDRDLWIRMSWLARIHLLPDALVKVRVHAGSMSTHAPRMMENMSQVLAKACSAGAASDGWSVWRQADAFLNYQTAWMHRDAGNHRAAVSHLLKSFLAWPFFTDPHSLNENYLFRLRSLRQFLAESLHAPRSTG